MAPPLYGTSSAQDCTSVVVMGLLGDGWTTLLHYSKNIYRQGIPEPHRSTPLKRLEDILGCLSAGGMIHGDFWMEKTMLKPGEAEAMLSDIDWAGGPGKARYPVTRSEDFNIHLPSRGCD